MIDQLVLYIIEFLIFLSAHWRSIVLGLAGVAGAIVAYFIVKEIQVSRERKAAEQQRQSYYIPSKNNKRSLDAPIAKPSRQTQAQPKAEKLPSMKADDARPVQARITEKSVNHKSKSIPNFNPKAYDVEEIKEHVIRFLSKNEIEGAPFYNVKNYTWACVRQDKNLKKAPSDYEASLRQVLNTLKKEKVLQYKPKDKIWKCDPKYHPVILHDLTDKERKYFKAKGLGEGWCRLDDAESGHDALWWMHQNFSPDEFEQFCCAILEHLGAKNVQLPAKRPSGADGGIDGEGDFIIDGKSNKFAIQAKKYRPDRYVDTDTSDKLVGSLTKRNIDYGFIITTSFISDIAHQEVKEITNEPRNNIKIELIDKHRLLKCMEFRGDSPHGFGLHKTDDLGLYYLNRDMLKRLIAKYA